MSKTETRLYAVTDGERTRLIEATNGAQAVKHCAKRFKCSVPSTKEVAALMFKGVTVELAGSEGDAQQAALRT